MKIADYPKSLPLQEQYTAGDVAVIYGVSHRTACKWIDEGAIKGFTLPGSKERRVLLTAIQEHVEANPHYKYVLDKIEGFSST